MATRRTRYRPLRGHSPRGPAMHLGLRPRPPEQTGRVRAPAQVIALALLAGLATGTGLLMLPVARAGRGGADLVTAFFTATSSLCVTGLGVVDTGTYWSGFGQAVMLSLSQIGGIGVMTLASLLALLVSRRLGLRSRLVTISESQTSGLGDVGRVLLRVASVSVTVEVLVAVPLAIRFATAYDEGLGRSVWLAVWHSVEAFNNAGFALFSDSFIGFVGDPFICLPVAAAIFLGALGFPVLFELRRELGSPSSWSVHTKLTVLGTSLLVPIGTAATLVGEWSNPDTLGPLDMPTKLLAAFFHDINARSAGFNSVDVGAMNEESWLVTGVMMFIGAGSAGTGGGIKVTTFLLLGFAIWAEVRGDREVNVFGRRVSSGSIRQALAVALLAVALVIGSSLFLMAITDLSLDVVVFEVISAFATCGLSTGITADLPAAGKLLLCVVMFVGRLGPITFASSMALRERTQLYRLPEERPIVG